jgi:hypothetical protein
MPRLFLSRSIIVSRTSAADARGAGAEGVQEAEAHGERDDAPAQEAAGRPRGTLQQHVHLRRRHGARARRHQRCRIAGKSQSVVIMINPIIRWPRLPLCPVAAAMADPAVHPTHPIHPLLSIWRCVPVLPGRDAHNLPAPDGDGADPQPADAAAPAVHQPRQAGAAAVRPPQPPQAHDRLRGRQGRQQAALIAQEAIPAQGSDDDQARGGESFLRVHWVAVPEAMCARRVNRRLR